VDSMLIQALINGILFGGVYVLISVGLSLTFGVMHIINVAQGDLVILGAYLTYWMYLMHHIDPILMVPVLFISFFTLGYAMQGFLVNRLMESPPLMNLVFFFGFSILLSNISLILWGPFTRILTTELSGASIELYSVSIPILRLVAFMVSIVVIVMLYLFLKKTRIGIAIVATYQNREAARLMGIDVSKMYKITLGIGFGTAGVAGALIAQITSFHPPLGVLYTLFAFFITVMGGMGYLPGTFIGGLILGLLQSYVMTYYNPILVYFLAFLMLYIILLTRPKGIFGKGV